MDIRLLYHDGDKCKLGVYELPLDNPFDLLDLMAEAYEMIISVRSAGIAGMDLQHAVPEVVIRRHPDIDPGTQVKMRDQFVSGDLICRASNMLGQADNYRCTNCIATRWSQHNCPYNYHPSSTAVGIPTVELQGYVEDLLASKEDLKDLGITIWENCNKLPLGALT